MFLIVLNFIRCEFMHPLLSHWPIIIIHLLLSIATDLLPTPGVPKATSLHGTKDFWECEYSSNMWVWSPYSIDIKPRSESCSCRVVSIAIRSTSAKHDCRTPCSKSVISWSVLVSKCRIIPSITSLELEFKAISISLLYLCMLQCCMQSNNNREWWF